MTPAAKRRFMRDLCANVLKDAIDKVPHMPDDWDGHELRRYLADKFEEAAFTIGRKGPYGKPWATRWREYRNTIAVSGKL